MSATGACLHSQDDDIGFPSVTFAIDARSGVSGIGPASWRVSENDAATDDRAKYLIGHLGNGNREERLARAMVGQDEIDCSLNS